MAGINGWRAVRNWTVWHPTTLLGWVAHVMFWQRVKISDRAAESLIPRILMTHHCYNARTLMTPGQLLKTTNIMRKCENTKQHLAELKGGASNTSAPAVNMS